MLKPFAYGGMFPVIWMQMGLTMLRGMAPTSDWKVLLEEQDANEL